MAHGSGQQRKLGAIEPEVLMSPAQAEQITIDIKAGLDRVDELVAETAVKIADAKARGAWRVLGFDTWGEYVREEFGTERRYANRLARYGEMVELLTEASRGALGPRGIQEALPEKGFRALPDETLENLPAAVAAAVKGKHALRRAEAALSVLAEARKVEVDAGPITSEQGRKLPTPEATDEGAVPDQGPDGVTPGGVDTGSPQEPPPPTVPDPSPPVAAVLGTGSPPPERTTPTAVRSAVLLLTVTSVEDIRSVGHALVRDLADRAAAADGRRLVTLAEWADLTGELRRLREAATTPSKRPAAEPAASVASGGQSGRKTPTTPPTSDPTGACTHPPARWNRLAYGVFCGVPGCGAKVR